MASKKNKKKIKVSKTETIIGIVILILLGVIATFIYQQQFNFNPAVDLALSLEEKSTATAGNDLGHFAPDTLKPMTPQELFDPETLSEKINGKAELYLPSGFRELRCRRFADREDPAAWLEVFAFDMGTTRNAYAVYSQQKRSDAKPSDLTRHSYKTANAFYFVHGQFYLELVSGMPNEKLLAAMETFTGNFIDKTKVQEETIPGLDLFPTENLIPQSVKLQPNDAFGYDRFDNLFIAKYRIDGIDITAFISERENASKAKELVDAYYKYLKMFDAVDISVGIENAKAVEMFDTIEIFFNSGKYIAGVHEASDKAAAEKIAARLYQQLKKVTDD